MDSVNKESERFVRLSSATGSWAFNPHPDRIPQIDEDATRVTACTSSTVDSIKSSILPFQENY